MSRVRKLEVGAGQIYGRWTVEVADDGGVPHKAFCRCACGTTKWVIVANLVAGKTSSCGCGKRQKLSEQPQALRHGQSQHPLYDVWYQMVQRCTNPRNASFPDYGAKDVRIYGPWFEVSQFIHDIETSIGPRPEGETSAGRALYSIDRIDPYGNYEPGNVHWATYSEQRVNRRR